MPLPNTQLDSPPLSPKASQLIDISQKATSTSDEIGIQPFTFDCAMSNTPPDSVAVPSEILSDDSQIADSDTSTLEVEAIDNSVVTSDIEELEPVLTRAGEEMNHKDAEDKKSEAEEKRINAEKKKIETNICHESELERIKHLDGGAAKLHNSKTYRNMVLKWSRIHKYWAQSAHNAGERPLKHAITFGEEKGERVTSTLEQVQALVPQVWQRTFRDSSFFERGEESWLDENLMNVLVHIATRDDRQDGSVFGISLAANINHDMDQFYKEQHDMNYVTHLLEKVVNDPEQYPAETRVFTFPQGTDRIVWFWNYWGNHWTTVCSLVEDEQWKHFLFNSFEDWRPHNRYWSSNESKQIERVLDPLEESIQKLSGFPIPTTQSTLKKAVSPEQDNIQDCGAFTVYNAVCVLTGQQIDINTKGTWLRLRFIDLILQELETKFGPLHDFYQFWPEDLDEKDEKDGSLSSTSSGTSSTSSKDSSPKQLPNAMPSSPPASEDAIISIDPFYSDPEVSAEEGTSARKRSASPDAVDIFTPSSSPSAQSTGIHDPMQASPGVDTTDPALASTSGSPTLPPNLPNAVEIDSSTVVDVETESSDPFYHSPKRVRRSSTSSPSRSPKSARVSSPRSIRRVSPQATATGMMGISRPSSAAKASSAPPAYDALQSCGHVCTEPPVENDMHLAAMHEHDTQRKAWHKIFPLSRGLKMDEMTQRIHDLDTLEARGILQPGYIAMLNGQTEEGRERALLGLIQTYKPLYG